MEPEIAHLLQRIEYLEHILVERGVLNESDMTGPSGGWHPPGSFNDQNGRWHRSGSFKDQNGRWHPAGWFQDQNGQWHPPGWFKS